MTAFQDTSFPATREAALSQARQFAPHMGEDYAKNRNFVVPGHPNVSMLAPAIRVRLISEQEVAHIALDEHKDLWRCEKFVQEICWRSYWRSWLELRPAVWSRYLSTRSTAQKGLAKVQQKRIHQIERAESGVSPIDEFVSELLATGYMHNHARMWFAAYWIHVEKLPWELGADFFERQLLCACPASNTLSWRWVAGLQTRGKAYLVRRSNLEKFCDPAYLGDEHGMDQLEHPTAVSIADISDDDVPTQQPDFDLELKVGKGDVGLWIMEDDFSPETSLLADSKFSAICTSVVAAPPLSESSNGKRGKYRVEAANDAGKRAEAHWNSSAENLEAKDSKHLATAITQWAKAQKLVTVVALKPFVGPTDDALIEVEARLKDEGIELKLLRRAEDARVLSAATAGYFRFWQTCKKQGFPL